MKKVVLIIFSTIFLLFGSVVPVYADYDDGNLYVYYKDKTYIMGGLNTFNGEKLDSREALISKENELRNRGYVLCSSDKKEISEEEYNLLAERTFWFRDEMQSEHKANWALNKVYIHRGALDDYFATVDPDTHEATVEATSLVSNNAVVLSYAVFYSRDRVGTISDEFNENMPDFLTGAYMEIDSPLDIEITLIHWDEQYYYRFYITKDTPFMVKLPVGNYKVVDINTVKFSTKESALPSSNFIPLDRTYMDRDNPYVLNVSKVINKYGIPKADLYGMPDLSLDKNQNIPEERTVVDAEALEQAIAKAQAEIDRDEAEQAKKEEARKEALTIGDNSKTEEAAAEKKEKEKKSRLVSAGVITAALLVIISAVKAIAGKLSRKAGEDDESSED